MKRRKAQDQRHAIARPSPIDCQHTLLCIFSSISEVGSEDGVFKLWQVSGGWHRVRISTDFALHAPASRSGANAFTHL